MHLVDIIINLVVENSRTEYHFAIMFFLFSVFCLSLFCLVIS